MLSSGTDSNFCQVTSEPIIDNSFCVPRSLLSNPSSESVELIACQETTLQVSDQISSVLASTHLLDTNIQKSSNTKSATESLVSDNESNKKSHAKSLATKKAVSLISEQKTTESVSNQRSCTFKSSCESVFDKSIESDVKKTRDV